MDRAGSFAKSPFVRDLAVVIRRNRVIPEPLSSFVESILFRFSFHAWPIVGDQHLLVLFSPLESGRTNYILFLAEQF